MALSSPSFIVILSLVAVLLLFLGLFSWLMYQRATQRERELRGLAEWFADLVGPLSPVGLSEATAVVATVPWLEDAWSEYSEGLIELPSDFRRAAVVGAQATWGANDASEEAAPALHNTLTIEQFFSDTLLTHSIHVWRFHMTALDLVPAMATSIGMLGTFGGIIWGLRGIDPVNLGEGVGTLVSSLGAAFVTSVLGLAASMLLSGLNARADSRLSGAMEGLRQAIERKIPRVTAEALLARSMARAIDGPSLLTTFSEQLELQREQVLLIRELRDESEQSRARLAELADDVAEKLGKRVETAINGAFAPQLARMEEHLSRVSGASADASRAFVETSFAAFSGELERVFAELGGQLTAFGSRMGAAEGTFGALERHLREATDAQRAVIQQAGGVLATSQQQGALAGDQLKEVTQVAARLATLAESLGAEQSRLAEGSAHLVGAQSRLAERVTEASGLYADQGAQLGAVLAQLTGEVQRLGGLTENLAQATETAATSVLRSSESLVARSAQETQLVGDFQTIARELSAGMSSSSAVLGALRQAAEQMQALSTQAQSMAGRIEQMTARVDQTSSETGDQLRLASRSFSEAAERITAVVGQTHAWAGETTDAIERFGRGLGEVVSGTLKAYDHSLASAVQSLGGAMRELEDQTHELSENLTAHAR